MASITFTAIVLCNMETIAVFHGGVSSIVTSPHGNLQLLREGSNQVHVSTLSNSAPMRNMQAVQGNGQAIDVDVAFKDFLSRHRKTYDSDSKEYEMRQALFKQRLAAAHAQNARPSARWKAAASRFSDFTDAERAVMRGYRGRHHAAKRAAGASLFDNAESRKTPLPDTVSWQHLKVADRVRDQGRCGSCWAFAAAGVLEAHYEIYSSTNGSLRTFSPQQILECTPNPDACGGTGGCQGATVELGMAWILKSGVATEEEVPYRAVDSDCSIAKPASPEFKVLSELDSAPGVLGGAVFGMQSWQALQSNAAYPLAEALAKYGPVAVSAAAGGWYEYSEGVFDGCESDWVVDHAVILYGYGKDDSSKYWLIRNSWGSDWGERGFIRLLRHDDDDSHCGTDTDPSQGTGCRGGPLSVKVCGTCGVLYDSVVPHFAGSPRLAAAYVRGSSASNLVRMEISSVGSTSPAISPVVDAVLPVKPESNAAAPSIARREARRHDRLA